MPRQKGNLIPISASAVSKPYGTALYWSGRYHKFRETTNPRFNGFCTWCAQRRKTRAHDRKRCRYEDCAEQHPVGHGSEQITCETCRADLCLPSITGKD